MTTVNLSQQQYRDARRQFGRSMIVQLLIFMSIQFGVLIVSFFFSFIKSALVTLIANGGGIRLGSLRLTISQSILTIHYIFMFINFAISIAVLFLHRSVTFRSSDSVLHNALPLAGLDVLGGLVGTIIASLIIGMNSNALIQALLRSRHAALLFVVFAVLSLLTGALVIFAKAGTVRLACKKNILFLLPLLGVIPASILDTLIINCVSYSSTNMLNSLYQSFSSSSVYVISLLLSIAQSLLSWLVGGLATFFAMRMLVYRDSYDTTPGAQRNIIRRYLMAYPLALRQMPPAAALEAPFEPQLAEPAPVQAPAPVQPVPEAAPVVPVLDARKEE